MTNFFPSILIKSLPERDTNLTRTSLPRSLSLRTWLIENHSPWVISKLHKFTRNSRTWVSTDKNLSSRWTRLTTPKRWMMSYHSTTSSQLRDPCTCHQMTCLELARSLWETCQDLQTRLLQWCLTTLFMVHRLLEFQPPPKRDTSQEKALGKRTDLAPPTSRETFQFVSWALNLTETTLRS